MSILRHLPLTALYTHRTVIFSLIKGFDGQSGATAQQPVASQQTHDEERTDMEDAYAQFTTGLESPAVRALEITPDDGTDLSEFSRALNVATSGTVRITTLEDNIVTLFVAAGIAFPIRVRRVWATGTTAGGIVALY